MTACCAEGVEYPSPNRLKIGTTEQALLTNQKPEPSVRCLPSESTMLATPLIIYCISSMSFSGWLIIFLACHWNTKTLDWLRPRDPICLRPNPTPQGDLRI
uniref:Uncharacterized protein n=1 Tax=Mesocestoides corti TaxID=53468 RepID=A0A5K3FW10_MESCO